MKQIHLFCPHCFVKLEAEFYRKYLERVYCICLMCGGTLQNCDVNLPRYKSDLWAGLKLERQICQICALTGKSPAFIRQFVNEAKMSADDLERLCQKIALGEWSFDED